MSDIFDLSGRVAIVTGSGGDIGKVISDALIDSNAKVYGFDLQLKDHIDSNSYTQINCDLQDRESFAAHCKKIYRIESRIDILINNAGVTIPTRKNGKYSFDDWNKTIDINLSAPFFCSQIVKDYMAINKKGSIINITSIAAELGFPNNPAYGASKGGLKALSKSLAAEWAKFGIRVNCIGPGYVGQGMTKKSFIDENIRKHRESMMMIKKWNTSNEIAYACIYLSSDASAYITGQDIYVDGGWTSKGFPDL